MNKKIFNKKYILMGITTCLGFVGSPAMSAQLVTLPATIDTLAINGGSDVPNVGLTCIKLNSVAVSASCNSGYLAVPNNNSQLISSLLAAKIAGKKIQVYYEDTQDNLHCPGIVFTSCGIISIFHKE